MDLNEIQQEELMRRLDTDGDGEIDYQEMAEGRRRFADREHAMDPRWETKFKDVEEESGSSFSSGSSDAEDDAEDSEGN